MPCRGNGLLRWIDYFHKGTAERRHVGLVRGGRDDLDEGLLGPFEFIVCRNVWKIELEHGPCQGHVIEPARLIPLIIAVELCSRAVRREVEDLVAVLRMSIAKPCRSLLIRKSARQEHNRKLQA